MDGQILTTWGVVLDVDESPGGDDPIDEAAIGRRVAGWFEAGRRAYFAGCPRLAGLLLDKDAVLSVSAEWIAPLPPAPAQGSARVAVSVIELRPSSFDMAFRARHSGGDAAPTVNGRCTVTIERRSTGQPIAVPREVRDELIAIQIGARDQF